MDIPPAIRRRYSDKDRDVTVISEPFNSVSMHRGLGYMGRTVQIVEHDCPSCNIGFDRMVRLTNVNPEELDGVQYWCLNPNCKHYLRDELSWAFAGSYPQHTPSV
jgi:hypothetical protein